MSKAPVFSIVEQFIRFALAQGMEDDQEAHAILAKELGLSPKLLRFNPELHRAMNVFEDQPNLSKVLDWTIRDWLRYHHIFIEQGYRYGMPHLQQKWMGRTILKTPFDCWVYQEIIHRVQPDMIVELGVKFGGSALYFAHLLDIIDDGEVIGVDIDLSNATDVQHPRITLMEGNSVAPEIVAQIHECAHGKRVIVMADSDHEKSHVLKELEAYHDLVPVGSYFIVEDGISDLMGWIPVPTPGAYAATKVFLKSHPEFEPDRELAEKYLITSNPDGYLLRVSE